MCHDVLAYLFVKRRREREQRGGRGVIQSAALVNKHPVRLYFIIRNVVLSSTELRKLGRYEAVILV